MRCTASIPCLEDFMKKKNIFDRQKHFTSGIPSGYVTYWTYLLLDKLQSTDFVITWYALYDHSGLTSSEHSIRHISSHSIYEILIRLAFLIFKIEI